MTLYEINEALRNALNSVDPDELEIQRADKIEGIALSIKEDIALADAIEKEAKTMLDRAKSVKGRAEWKKRYLTNALTHEDGMEKYQSARVSIGWRKSERVEIADEPGFIAVHPDFCATKVEVQPDRTLIKKTIKDGGEVTGAVLVESQSIQIK